MNSCLSDKFLTHTKTCDTRHSSRSSIIPSRKIDLYRKITLCSLLYIMRWQILPSLVIMVTCYALQFQATTPPQPRSDFSSTNCNPHISGNTTRQNQKYIYTPFSPLSSIFQTSILILKVLPSRPLNSCPSRPQFYLQTITNPTISTFSPPP